MKKLVACVLLVAACGGSGAGKQETTTPPPEENVAPQPPAREALAYSGIAACDEYVAFAFSYQACDSISSETRQAAIDAMQEMAASWGESADYGDEERLEVSAACADARDALTRHAGSMGCTLEVPEGDYLARLSVSPQVTGDPSMIHCDEYIASVYRYMQCDKVPQQARDSAQQGIDAMRQGWADMTGVPDDVKAQTDAACAMGVDALREGAQAMGCSI